METAIDKSLVERAVDLKSSLTKLRSLLNVDGESNVPQWCKDRIAELEEHLKEEKFIRSKQEESYDALSKCNKELTGQIEQLTKSRQTVEEKLHRSEEAVHLEKKLLENKEKKWKEEKQQMELQHSQKQAKIETLTARNAYYKKENEDFKDDHRRVREIQKQLDQLKEEMKQKDAENERLKEEMAAKQAANEEKYNEEVNKRETAEKRLEDKEASLNQELKETKASVEKLEEEMNTAAKSLASFLKVIEETIVEAEGQDDDDDDDDETVDLNLEPNVFKIGVAIENLQGIVGDCRDQNAELKQDLEDIRKKLHESQGELMDLQEDFESQQNSLAEYKSKSMETVAASAVGDGDSEEQSHESRGENDEEMELMEGGQPGASQNDDGSDIVEVQPPTEGNRALDDDNSDIVEVQPKGENSDRDDESDIVEIQEQQKNAAKRPLEEDEEAPVPPENAEDQVDELPPSAKRARVAEESDSEGSEKSITFGIDSEGLYHC